MNNTLYEINKEIEEILDTGFSENAVDKETGEIIREKLESELDNLKEARAVKVENIALYIKNAELFSKEIEEEEKRLKERREKLNAKLGWLKSYLTNNMLIIGDVKFETPRVKIGFRKSESVNILNPDIIPKEYLNEKITYTPDKTKIKAAIKSGEIVSGAVLSENQNIQIK